MKKQIFLLSVSLMMLSSFVVAKSCSSSCNTSCETSCSSSSKSCKSVCVPDHGHTYRRVENAYQAGTPMMLGTTQTNRTRSLSNDDKKGQFDITVFGGANTHRADAASYYLPYGHSKLTFSGDLSDTTATFAKVMAAHSIAASGATTTVTIGTDGGVPTGGTPTNLTVDPAAFKFDTNKDTSIVRPWNFGITFAALFEPQGASADGQAIGTGLVTNPEFKSTIAPELRRSRVGFGLGLRYHFSEGNEGFFGTLTTSVEHVRSRICLNETEVKTKAEADQELTLANFGTGNPDGGLTLPGDPTATGSTGVLGSINEAYINATTGTGFPVEETTVDADNGGGKAPKNVTEAFDQAAWNYGKIGCEQKETRLADIELAVGYQWHCSDCASHSAYLGLVIPTGNKVCADYVAPAVVGNGFHAGIMTGASTELLVTDKEDYQLWCRVDTNSRYLFKNTQKRSFDLLGNEWSRYMMTWKDKASYEAAMLSAVENNQAVRNYEPGINVFTHDMHVKPRFQGRINSALHYRSDCFRAELGWNVFARQKECVEFACDWTTAPAFADSSSRYGLALNNHRTIYNDAQTSAINVVHDYRAATSLFNFYDTTQAATSGGALAASGNAAVDRFDDFAITKDDVDFNSAATPATVSHTPYLTLGWSWDSEYNPQVSVGASYEFSASNTALNQWTVWGKFEMAF